MFFAAHSGTIIGITGIGVSVEVDLNRRGFPSFTVVGLANKAVGEAKERVRTAIKNSGFPMPNAKITVNLSPAHIPKTGTQFDLAIAVAVLAASEQLPAPSLQSVLFLGELSLSGEVQPVHGIMPLIQYAIQQRFQSVIIPKAHQPEAGILADQIEIVPAHTLDQIVWHLRGRKLTAIDPLTAPEQSAKDKRLGSWFSQIHGQHAGKRAITIAAAGGLGLHLTGPPGGGKTLLARALHELLPPLSKIEQITAGIIQSVAASSDGIQKTADLPPFQAPHHSITMNGLIGGGSPPRPGVITQAHLGVLFLDELPEFSRMALESLRQILEDEQLTIHRSHSDASFPCRIQLVAASNPCTCGNYGYAMAQCQCTPTQIQQYQKKLRGPLIDRIAMHHMVLPDHKQSTYLSDRTVAQNHRRYADICATVSEARQRQYRRYHLSDTVSLNRDLRLNDVSQWSRFEPAAEQLLKKVTQRYTLSPRAVQKLIQIAQTIADCEANDSITKESIAEAVQYRSITS